MRDKFKRKSSKIYRWLYSIRDEQQQHQLNKNEKKYWYVERNQIISQIDNLDESQKIKSYLGFEDHSHEKNGTYVTQQKYNNFRLSSEIFIAISIFSSSSSSPRVDFFFILSTTTTFFSVWNKKTAT